jgi:hypothetical protein
MWIAPGCGFVGAVITHIVWRWLNLPYRHEFVPAVMLFIMISVSAYIYGGWESAPVASGVGFDFDSGD